MEENLDQSVGELTKSAETLCSRMVLVSELADKLSKKNPEISSGAPVKRLEEILRQIVEEIKDVRKRYGKESWTIFHGLQQRDETVTAERAALDSRQSEFDASCNTLTEDQHQLEVQCQELEADKEDHANRVRRHEEAVADMTRKHAENLADINRQRQEMQERLANLERREAALDKEKTETTRRQGQMDAEKDELKRQREQVVRDQSAAAKAQQDAMKAVGGENQKNAVDQERLKGDRKSFEAQKADFNREMTREKEELAGKKHQLARDQEKLARDQEKLARDQDKLADDEEDISSKEQRLISELEQLDHDRTELATDQGKMIASQEKLATDEQKFSKDRQDLDEKMQQHALKEGKLIAKQEALIAEKEIFSSDRTKLTADKEKLAIDHGKMIAGQEALAGGKQKLSDDRQDLEKKVQQCAIEEGKLIAKQDAMAAEKEILASDRKRLTDDIEKHAIDQGKMADEQKTLDHDKQQLASDQEKLETDLAQFASDKSSLQRCTSEFEETRQRETAKLTSDKDTVALQLEGVANEKSALTKEKADLTEATAKVASDRQDIDRERLALDERRRGLGDRESNLQRTMTSLNAYIEQHFAGVRQVDREELASLRTSLEESRSAASLAQAKAGEKDNRVTELGNLRASDLAENARLHEKVASLQKTLESSQQVERAEPQPEGSRSTASLVRSDQGPREADKRAREESSSPQPRKNRKMEDESIAKLAAQSWEDVIERMTSFFGTWKVERSKDSQLCPTVSALVQMSAILASDQTARDFMSRFGGDYRRQDWVCFDTMVKSGHKWIGSIIDPETLSCPQHGQKGCLQVQRVGNRELKYRYIGREVRCSEILWFY